VRLGLAIVALVLVANAVALAPELSISLTDSSHSTTQFALVQGMVQASQSGGNPLDFWSPEFGLGVSAFRIYQPLAHALAAVAAWFAPKGADLATVFHWVSYLAAVLLPLSFFACGRLLGFSPPACTTAALLAPLVMSSEFPQSVATHFLLLSVGFCYRTLRRGSHPTASGVMLGLTALCRFTFGALGAVAVVAMALMPDAKAPRGARIARALWIGSVALALTAFQILPWLQDRPLGGRDSLPTEEWPAYWMPAAVMAGAWALGWIWRAAAPRLTVAAPIVLIAALAFPPAKERAAFLTAEARSGRANLAAFQAERRDINLVVDQVRANGGRVYSGSTQIRAMPFDRFLLVAGVPAIARFDANNAEDYRRFNVSSLITSQAAVPGFLQQRAQIGRFRIFDTPASGYFDVAEEGGAVVANRQNGQVYEADVEVSRAANLVFRMSWHPNWKVLVDGMARPTVMLAPGFVGAALEPGRHQVVCRYQPDGVRALFGFAGIAAVLLFFAVEKFGGLGLEGNRGRSRRKRRR